MTSAVTALVTAVTAAVEAEVQAVEAATERAIAAATGELLAQLSAWQAGEGTRYAAAVAGVVGAEVAAWSGQVRAEAGAASARALVELGAWSMTALSGAVLGVRLAQAESDFAAAAGRAAAAAIAQAGAASAGLTAAFSGLAAAHTAAVAGLAVGYAGTVAGAQAEEAKARQFADGTATIAKAQAGVTATGAVGAAAQTATSASAAASVALTAALTAAATAYVEAVAGAQRDLAKSLAAIGHAREVAGIDAAATHAHAVLSADVSRDTALAGVTLDFSQRRTALSLEIVIAGADLVQAKMIQSAVEGTKASLEATERAWNEWIATLHERRSAGYGFWELVSVGSASGYGGGPTHPGNGADGFGLRDWLSLGLGSIPGLGTALAFIEFGTGMDYVAGRAVDQRLAGVGLLAALLPGGRILGKGAAVAARHGDGLFGAVRRGIDVMLGAGKNARGGVKHYTDFADEAAEIMENAARSRGLNPNQQVFNMALSRKRALERLESLTPRVEEHIGEIINNPGSRDVPHWQGEIKAWLRTMENAAQYTGKATSEEWLFKIRSWRLLLDASK